MICSTMPRASVLLVTSLLTMSCCRRPASAPGDVPARGPSAEGDKRPQEAPDVSSVRTPSDVTAAVAIRDFDCEAIDDPARGPARLVPPGRGLASWALGGPGGAAWNAADVRCAASVASTCDKGALAIELRVAGAIVAERQIRIANRGAEIVELTVAASTWPNHLDELGTKTRPLPYRTAVFRLTAVVECESPAFGPGLGPRGEFAADSMFLAGFAWGE
jgi:hypothetical protein